MLIPNITNKYQNNLVSHSTYGAFKPISFQGINLVTSLKQDTVQFTNNSYLSTTFIKSLTKIEAKNNLERFTKIKDAILKQMGYKSPEALKLKILDTKILKCSFDAEKGILNFSQGMIEASDDIIIPNLYHEIDHMDKFLKVYKAGGEKNFEDNLVEIKKRLLSKTSGEKDACCININHKFYKEMSKDTDIKDFEPLIWNKAIREYHSPDFKNYLDLFEYYNNPIENSAFKIESTVRKKLGFLPYTTKDYFPQNFISMINTLKTFGIKEPKEQDKIIHLAVDYAFLRKTDINILKLCKKRLEGKDLTPTERKYLDSATQQIDKNPLFKTLEFIQDTFLEAEKYLQKGKFTPKDIIEF